MRAIIPLAERPDLVPALAAALVRAWPDWYGPGGRADPAREARLRARAEGLPRAVVALDDAGAVIGTATLAELSIPTHAHLSPWLVGLWVDPGHRRRGLGAALVRAVRADAARRGLPVLHAATTTAEGLFLADGWTRLERVELPDHPGEAIAVLRCVPAR